MPKLDRSGLGLLLSAGVAAWIVENDPFGVQEVQGKRASALNMPSLRSAPARPPCLLRARKCVWSQGAEMRVVGGIDRSSISSLV